MGQRRLRALGHDGLRVRCGLRGVNQGQLLRAAQPLDLCFPAQCVRAVDPLFGLLPLLTTLFPLPCYAVWRFGVRKYKSTGS